MRRNCRINPRNYYRALLIVVCVLLSACATAPREDGKSSQSDVINAIKDSELFWWRVKFKLQWPERQQPDFSYHLLIADRILRPVIALRGNDITLWRFHRRASRDNAGHQFSFIFFTDRETATGVKTDLESNQLVSILLHGSIIESVNFTDGESGKESQVSATSDPAWPAEIQQSWPYFIMGASQSWLEQIKLVGAQTQQHNDSSTEAELEEMVQYYRELNEKLSAQWAQYGRHAYLHHLNALYGYVPVYIQETEELWNF